MKDFFNHLTFVSLCDNLESLKKCLIKDFFDRSFFQHSRNYFVDQDSML